MKKSSRWYVLTTLLLVCLTALADSSTKIRFTATNADGLELKYVVLSESEATAALEGGQTASLLNIPQTVTYAGRQFTVTEVAANAFSGGNMRLNSVVLPPTITKIGAQAFALCIRLNSINFPEGLLEIGEMAFASTKLQSLSLPKSLQSVGPKAFVPKWDRPAPGDYVVESLPSIVTESNCESLGIAQHAVAAYYAAHASAAGQVSQQTIPQQTIPQQTVPQPQTVSQQPTDAQHQPTAPAIAHSQKVVAGRTDNQQQTAVAPQSDVDTGLPTTSTVNENTFAVVIANENYQEEVNVDYALNDGEMFRQYCQKVLGLPEANIHIRKDATRNNIIAEMAWMKKVAEAYQGQANFIVYYAGHGIPDEKSGSAYLLPVDGKGSMIETAFSVQEFYKQLGEMPSMGVVVFMDACFSGSKRGNGMLAAARGVAIKAKKDAPQGRMVVFSAAQGDETAYPLKEQGHGLFTYYLLKKLKETAGQVPLGELGDYIKEQVSRKSIVANGKSQTPSINASSAITDDWKTMQLK